MTFSESEKKEKYRHRKDLIIGIFFRVFLLVITFVFVIFMTFSLNGCCDGHIDKGVETSF